MATLDSKPPSLATCVAYSALVVPMQIAWGPLLSTIPALYATYSSISLQKIGISMMVLRLLDVLLDLLIGLFSDRTLSPWGRRKPWMLAGALTSLPATWALFAVPRNAGVVFFVLSMGFAYLGWSMMEIPHTAWLGELSQDDAGRSLLSGWRTAAVSAGGLVYLAIPFLARFSDAAMTPDVMATARQILLVMLPPALLVTLLLPSGVSQSAARPAFGASIRSLAESPTMRMLGVSLVCDALASGMCAACYLFYLGTYLGVAGSFSYIGLTTYCVEMLSGLASPRLISRIGKRASLAVSNSGSIVSLLGMALVRPGPGAGVAVAFLFTITSLIDTCGDVAVPVMAAEAANADEERTGSNKLGNFMAATVLCRKTGIALGGGAAFLLLAAFGFNPKAANTHRAMIGFDTTLFVVPGLLYLASVVAAMHIPEGRRCENADSE